MKKLFKTTLLTASLLGALASVSIAQDNPASENTGTDSAPYIFQDPVAKINDREISKSEFDNFLLLTQSIPVGDVEQVDNIDFAEQLVLLLATQEALSDEAKQRGLDKDKDYQMRVKLIGDLFLSDMLFQDMMAKNEIAEEDIKAQYEIATAALEKKEYQASHILVATEEEAQTLIDAINKEETTFAAAAKEKSLDTATAARDGNIGGWFRASMMDPSFAAAVQGMEKETMSTKPVQSQFGYHVILLQDVRDVAVKPFAELDSDTKMQLAQPLFQKKIELLQKDVKVEIPASK